jgi:hypothetical protein
MRFALHPRVARRIGRFAALMTVAALAIPAAASAAAHATAHATASAASCPAQATTTPFTQWGDTGSYFLVPGANFEAPLSSSGWTVIDGERTLGNEPFYVGSSTDSYSLTLGRRGVAISPAFCVDDSMPYMRFFAQALGMNGDLQVRLVVQTASGRVDIPFSQVADLAAGSMPSWAPTPQLKLTNDPALANGQTGIGRLVLDVAGSSSWQIDDIYVDPFRFG